MNLLPFTKSSLVSLSCRLDTVKGSQLSLTLPAMELGISSQLIFPSTIVQSAPAGRVSWMV